MSKWEGVVNTILSPLIFTLFHIKPISNLYNI
nr:MAG TPA_asm: hypothetical protein [Caudoviricetes sp.]